MKYRVGWPFWRFVFKTFHCTLVYRYDIYKTDHDYCAISYDIKGLGAEGSTIEEVVEAIENGAKEFVNLDLYGPDYSRQANIKPLGLIRGALS